MFSVIYITAGDREEAMKIGRILVDEGLAACANIFPITSIYRWKGKIEEGSEFGIFVKTRKGKIKDIIKRVKEIHSYEVPEVLFFRAAGGEKRFMSWVENNARGRNKKILKNEGEEVPVSEVIAYIGEENEELP